MRRTLALALVCLAACKTTPAAPTADLAIPAIDETALDRKVPPCDDFYRFACGGWLDRTEIPADKPAWARGFSVLEERNLLLLRRIAETAAAGKADPADAFADKVGDYWTACMDEAAVETRGLDDLKAEWALVDAIKDADGLVDAIARQHLQAVDSGFGLLVDQDAKDARQVIAILMQGGLSLPDRDYYLAQDEQNAAIRKRYLEHLATVLGLAGVPAAQAAAQAAAILAFETGLAESHFTQTEMRDPVRTYNRVDRAGLEKLAPAFGWARYFMGLGFPDLTAVSATTPRFVERLGKAVAETPLDTWKAYLRWKVLDRMAGARALPRAFVDADFRFMSASFTGAKELTPRWKHCVKLIDEGLGEALGRSYVRLHFGAEGKARTVRLVQEIEKAMGRDIDGLPWMDAATKEKAQKKLAAIANKVGYPEKWRDYATLEIGRASLFQDLVAAARFETRRQLARIGRPLDRTEWLMSPPTVNAYYNPSMNEMVFPAGILQPPFFNRLAPESVNYGAIGMVVGHELTHGFDDQGRKFDGDGNLTDWWTASVAKDFDAKAQCLVGQYAGYESVPGAKVNGELTLGENIADLGGLKLAMAAYRAASAAGEAGPQKPLAGLSPEQQLFVGYAQSWCFKAREEYARMMVTVDPHSPPRFRVLGPLSNLPDFAQAFACPAGSPMVRPPEQRCEIW